jgi:hypothetical protein
LLKGDGKGELGLGVRCRWPAAGEPPSALSLCAVANNLRTVTMVLETILHPVSDMYTHTQGDKETSQ